MKPTIMTKRPAECSVHELQTFCELVLSEGQVNPVTLRGYVVGAEMLAFAYYDDELCAVAAIKNAQLTYRRRIQRKSDNDFLLEEISREFGYVVVSPHHRGKRLSGALADSLLQGDKGMLFATSTTGNRRMHQTLERHRFKRSGKSYPSTEHPDQEIILFVRSEH